MKRRWPNRNKGHMQHRQYSACHNEKKPSSAEASNGPADRTLSNYRRYPMGFKAMRELENQSSSEIVFQLNSPRSGFTELISQSQFEKEKLTLCLKLIAKACESPQAATVARLLENIIKADQFTIVALQTFLIEIQTNFIGLAFQERAVVHLMEMLEAMQRVHPNSSLGTTILIIPLLNDTVKVLTSRGNDNYRLTDRVAKLEETKCQLREKFSLIPIAKRQEDDQPPDNFRDIAIFPDKADIQDKRPFLRCNVVNGRYLNVDHYLDVQFRLLREDFVRPLREGIAEYLELTKQNKDGRIKLQDVRVYSNVTFQKALVTDDGVFQEISFDNSRLQGIKWEHNKRLIFGSLVCLSANNFETMLFGTVIKRDPGKLQEGFVCVRFENQDQVLEEITEAFVMIETEAYFEAYRHVLLALQGITENTFPLKAYIVEVQKWVNPPDYLSDETTYCMNHLTNIPPLQSNEDVLKDEFHNSCCCLFYSKRFLVSILKDDEWPTASDLNLDISQWGALKTALTKEIAVIQGPPGTGKTYVGLKIIQTLLHNEKAWLGADRTPILVVCYTNHALDQFLKGVLEFTNSIVRIGGRSHCKALEPFNLRNLKREFHMNPERRHENYMGRHYHNSKEVVEQILQRIKEGEKVLASSGKDIMSEVDLLEEIGGSGSESLKMDSPRFLGISKRDTGKLLLYWLGQALPERVNGLQGEGDLIVEANQKTEHIQLKMPVENAEIQDSESEPEIDLDISDNEEDVVQIVDFPKPKKASILDVPDEIPIVAEAPRATVDTKVDTNEYDEEDVDFITNQRTDREGYGRAIVVLLNNEPDQKQEASQGASQNGWKTQGGRKKERKYWNKQIQNATAMTDQELEGVTNLWTLKNEDRWRLYKTWVDRFQKNKKENLRLLKEEYEKKLLLFGEVKSQEEVIIASRKVVVGMTTTGAAKHRHLVSGLQPKIVIVEEAAEVLESHIVTSMGKDTKHLILIGDHQQLRPNPTVYELAKKFKLEISLFERLINNGIPFQRLGIQHRMKPCISDLLVPTIYDELEDHPSVREYEEIKGFDKSMFFLKHEQLELKSDDDNRSKVNLHETQFLVYMCRYILQQGYSPGQITILSTYLGQMFVIKRLLHGHLKEVRVTVVDNFQGEENDIILLSFVRSNAKGQIGFLKTENRVCVALSRAKKALFCVGNFDIMTEQSKLWKDIIQKLELGNAVGNQLRLKCQMHGNDTLVASSFDFDRIPDGGCIEKCDFRLSCGHVCPRFCHPDDKEHIGYACKKPCAKKLCVLQHQCPKLCSDKCELCIVPVMKTVFKCQHQIRMPCHVEPEDIVCNVPCLKKLICDHICRDICGRPCGVCKRTVTAVSPCTHPVTIECHISKDEDKLKKRCFKPCERLLPCQHICSKLCRDECEIKCMRMVKITLPCQHERTVECHRSQDLASLMNSCPKRCEAVLKCDHRCIGTCGACFQGRLHVLCNSPCNKTLVCGHTCRSPCPVKCPPCRYVCENRCSHSRCKQMCGYPCVPCLEPCLWKCKHRVCRKLCGETCDRSPCNVPCRKRIRCGHKCIGLCGEPCPTLCRICHKKELTSILFGYEDRSNSRFIQLEDCDHVFELRGINKWFQNQSQEAGEIRVLRCPICQVVVRRNLRFNAPVKASLKKIELVKEKVFGQQNTIGEKKIALEHKIRGLKVECRFASFGTSPLTVLHNALNSERQLDLCLLVLYENYVNCLVGLRGVGQTLEMFLNYSRQFKVLVNAADKVKSYYKPASARLNTFVTKTLHRASDQQVEDLVNEVDRLQLLSYFVTAFGTESLASTPEASALFNKTVDTMVSLRTLNAKDKEIVAVASKQLKVLMGYAVIGVTQEEKVQIVEAMGFKQGHWFTCPNGHVYVISECGGAMVESKCNECGAAIGGGSHTLRSDNRVATAMDGARHGAWSDAANMGNYENF